MRYRPEIDGLRAVAVIPVILFHAGLASFGGGFVGVDVFFVISGYLITKVIVDESAANTFTLAGFYERRARRILPPLLLMVLLCVPLALLTMLPADLTAFSQSAASVAAFASNILFWRWSGYFDAPSALRPLLHTWSLAVEEQFYLIYPLLFLASWRSSKRRTVAYLGAALVLSLAAAQYFVLDRPFFAFFLLPTRAWELLLGALAAVWLSQHTEPRATTLWSQIAGLAGLGLIAASVLRFSSATPDPSLCTLAPTLGAALVVLFATERSWAGRLLGSAPLVRIGLVSYGAYLWHHPLLAFARLARWDLASPLVVCSLLGGVAALAWTSYAWLERPVRDRRRFTRRQVFLWGALGSATVAACGVVGTVSSGFLGRYRPEDRALAATDARAMGKFVRHRFIELQGRAFDSGGRRKILIVGDSYAEDLVNVLEASPFASRIQLSTHYISNRCGNVYVRTSLLPEIDPIDKSRCVRAGWFESVELRARMRDADEIWFAANWLEWVVPHLPESVANVRTEFGKEPLVFGVKNFGHIDLRELLRVPASERAAVRRPPERLAVSVDSLTRAIVPSARRVDLLAITCPAREACREFSAEGELLSYVSYDGRHLTPAGAQWMAKRISELPAIRAAVGDSAALPVSPRI
jgi:peptidoglycan/LPS O-acetylase OafA/YrhL